MSLTKWEASPSDKEIILSGCSFLAFMPLNIYNLISDSNDRDKYCTGSLSYFTSSTILTIYKVEEDLNDLCTTALYEDISRSNDSCISNVKNACNGL